MCVHVHVLEQAWPHKMLIECLGALELYAVFQGLHQECCLFGWKFCDIPVKRHKKWINLLRAGFRKWIYILKISSKLKLFDFILSNADLWRWRYGIAWYGSWISFLWFWYNLFIPCEYTWLCIAVNIISLPTESTIYVLNDHKDTKVHYFLLMLLGEINICLHVCDLFIWWNSYRSTFNCVQVNGKFTSDQRLIYNVSASSDPFIQLISCFYLCEVN